MKLNLTDIVTEEDRQRALAVLVAVAPVMRSDAAPTPAAVVEMPAAEPAKKTRRRKVNGVDEPESIADPAPVEPVVEPESIAERAPVEPATATVAEPAPATDDETAREELRQIARTRGVVWLREILASYQAARLGDLTLEQVQEALHVASQ